MKAIFISYNQAFHEEILDIMNKSNVRGYTCWEQVSGRGSKTGEPHLGDHAWPTLNTSLLSMVEDGAVSGFMRRLHELDQANPAMGLRAFSWNIETTI